MGALQDQTAVNIRERAGGRKQKPVTRPESRSKRLRCFFGIQTRLEHPRGLEGHLALSDPQRDPQQAAPDQSRYDPGISPSNLAGHERAGQDVDPLQNPHSPGEEEKN